jgi:hypothetical protein
MFFDEFRECSFVWDRARTETARYEAKYDDFKVMVEVTMSSGREVYTWTITGCCRIAMMSTKNIFFMLIY